MRKPKVTCTLITACQAIWASLCPVSIGQAPTATLNLLLADSQWRRLLRVKVRHCCQLPGTRRRQIALGCLPHGIMWGNVLRIANCHATCTDRLVLRIVVDAAPTPLVQRRRLRTELRRARSAADLTQDQVAQAMDWSLSKIIRIETGAVNVSTNDLKALLNLYNILDPERTSQLIELARAARQTSWWNKYKEAISDQYFQLIGYVEAASVVRSYEPLLIPGLLQTPEYAETTFQKFAESGEPSNLIQARMEIRLTRQQLFDRPTAPGMSLYPRSGRSPAPDRRTGHCP